MIGSFGGMNAFMIILEKAKQMTRNKFSFSLVKMGNTSCSKTGERELAILKRKIEILKKELENKYNFILQSDDSILSGGCGKNFIEAKVLNEIFTSNVVGIDLGVSEAISRGKLKVLKGSIESIPFPNNHFKFIHCYHVLEHVNNPQQVFVEFKRILSKDGLIFIGFPNRLRLTPMYLKSHENLSIAKMITKNLRDYKKKITGKFKNEYGAHAGFAEGEFVDIAQQYFGTVKSFRKDYIKLIYPSYRTLIDFAAFLKADNYFFPSNYYILRK